MINLVNISCKQLMNKGQTNRLFLFGVSKRLVSYKRVLPTYCLSDVVDYIVDNDESKWGREVQLDSSLYTVISPKQMIERICKEDKIIIVSIHYKQIISQLDAIEELNGIDCYVLDYIYACNDSRVDKDYYESCKSDEYCIPPVIHYCWFGYNPMPEEYLGYIESWKKMCPDYSIVQWDESNYDVNKHPYMARAYREKKWAFVSDYARLDIIHNNGGIYLDTDVELLRNLDELRRFRAFAGFESESFVATGLGFGAEKKNELIGKLLKGYDSVLPGDYVTCPVLQSKDLEMFGLQRNNTFQFLEYGGMAVLPSEFLAPMEARFKQMNITSNTYSIHHFSGSWVEHNTNTLDDNILTERIMKHTLRNKSVNE